MTLKDRTTEFNSVVETILQKKSGPPNISQKKSSKAQFAVIAAQIGRDISETTEKLERLTKLAKKKSLFDDPTIEIGELTVIINQDIKNINSQINALQQLNTTRKNKQTEHHSETVVDSLKSKLRTTTKGFSEVLELRTENLKTQQKEREAFTGIQSPAFGKRAVESPLYKQALNNHIDGSQNHDVAIMISDNAPSSHSLMTQERYVSSRAEAVISIERTITELQSIFQQLANLVAEQGEMIERIDANVEATASNVGEAQTALLKYLSGISNNRWLIIKMFLILILFVVVFVVFFV